MPESFLAARYMTRFACTGSACEDTCCHVANWTIPVSEGDYLRLEQALGASDEDRATFARLFALAPARPGGAFAVIQPSDDGFCALLDGERLCGVHRRFGDSLLPQVCSSYPRAVSQLGERFELTGRLSCPEVARLCLLADDAVEPVPIARELLGRAPIALQLGGAAAEDPYLALFEPVRQALVGLSSVDGFPVAARQFFVGYLAHRLGAFYRRAAPPFDPGRLAAELRELGRAPVLDALAAKFAATERQDALPLGVLLGLVRARLTAPVAPAFRRLVGEVAARYAGAPAGGDDPLAPLYALGPAALVAAHAARRDAAAGLDARLERYFHNYCKDYWIHDWYLQSASLLDHVVLLALRMALVRLLLLGHPALDEALALPDAAAREGACDRLAVKVFYAVTRAFDHNESVRASLARLVAERGLSTLAHVVAVLKL